MGDNHAPVYSETAERQRRKYASRNPVQRFLLRRFFQRIRCWLDEIEPKSVLDFGCGEGFFWKRLAELGTLPQVTGIDIRRDALAVAREQLPGLTFVEADLLDFAAPDGTFDLIIASEVLEHLADPGLYLGKLCRVSSRFVLLTVPHEPYFRLCNLLRGRDLRSLGNHPEHLQRWSRRRFTRFVSQFLMIEKVATSFPFILVLGRPRAQEA